MSSLLWPFSYVSYFSKLPVGWTWSFSYGAFLSQGDLRGALEHAQAVLLLDWFLNKVSHKKEPRLSGDAALHL